MTVTMRMDEYAAERRLAEAFGITVESAQIPPHKLENAPARRKLLSTSWPGCCHLWAGGISDANKPTIAATIHTLY
ncbi:MAG: hypothetical protein L0K41_03150 [Yaniella sp.]|nr:hypothetical protein [Yaniella sp.]